MSAEKLPLHRGRGSSLVNDQYSSITTSVLLSVISLTGYFTLISAKARRRSVTSSISTLPSLLKVDKLVLMLPIPLMFMAVVLVEIPILPTILPKELTLLVM